MVLEINRRCWLGLVLGGVAGRLSAAANLPIRLGGPIFLRSDDPEELAREHRRLGYGAAYCPVADGKDVDRVAAARVAFERQNVVIAEVGAWVNMLDPDPRKRKTNLAYVIERLHLAEAIGARNSVDIAGSYNRSQSDGPDPRNLTSEFFDATVENCRKVIDAVRPKRTRFTIEMMSWSLPDGPDSYLKLIKAIDRKQFGAHIDICNIINSPQRYYSIKDLIDSCFTILGPWVMSCHAKDLVGRAVHFAETVPGRGGVDYAAYLRNIARFSPDAPLMLEHLKSAEEYDEGKRYIFRVGSEIGVSFG